MLNEETRRKLREMNFGELVDALDLQEKQAEYLALPFDDRINLAVDYAYSAKYNAKVHRLIKAAKFRIADAVLFKQPTGCDQRFYGFGQKLPRVCHRQTGLYAGVSLKIYPCSRFDGVAQRSNVNYERQIQTSEEVQRIQAAHPR